MSKKFNDICESINNICEYSETSELLKFGCSQYDDGNKSLGIQIWNAAIAAEIAIELKHINKDLSKIVYELRQIKDRIN